MIKKSGICILVTLIIGFLMPLNAYAQSATPTPTPGSGSLSINPASITLNASGAKTNLSVVYTGNDITVAEIHLTLGSGIKINKFTVGSGLVVVYESTTTNEMHVGNLNGTITSGQTLFTFEVEATACSQTGQIGFDVTKTKLPGVVLSTSNPASYTISCTGGGTGSPTPTPATQTPAPSTTIINTTTTITTSYNPTTLPKTGRYSDQSILFLSSAGLFSLGIVIWVVLAKARTKDRGEEINLVAIE